MNVINIIPKDYDGNPQKALGYCWEDFSSKTPGDDIVVDAGNGVDYEDAAKKQMKNLGVTEAYINCMWCGGFSGKMEIGEDIESEDIQAPLTFAEVAANEQTSEELQLKELNIENKNKFGWCDKCHTYCYGDCQASVNL